MNPERVFPWGRNRLAILIFHRVLPALDPYRPGDPDAAMFDWQMRLLRRYFNPLSLAEALARMQDGLLPNRAVTVTFDDGYKDNYTIALPILKRYEIPATVFVATGFLNGGRMFNDTVIEAVSRTTRDSWDLRDLGLGRFNLGTADSRNAAIGTLLSRIKYLPPIERDRASASIARLAAGLPDDLMMTTDEVHLLHRAGIEIGGHTRTHPILCHITAEEAADEIAGNRRELQEICGTDIPFFAYPNGKPGIDYTDAQVTMVKNSGYQAAVSTVRGVAGVASDDFQLPRFTPWDRQPMQWGVRLLAGYA